MSQNSEKIISSVAVPIQIHCDQEKMREVIDSAVAEALEEHGDNVDAVQNDVIQQVNRRMEEFISFKIGEIGEVVAANEQPEPTDAG